MEPGIVKTLLVGWSIPLENNWFSGADRKNDTRLSSKTQGNAARSRELHLDCRTSLANVFPVQLPVVIQLPRFRPPVRAERLDSRDRATGADRSVPAVLEPVRSTRTLPSTVSVPFLRRNQSMPICNGRAVDKSAMHLQIARTW